MPPTIEQAAQEVGGLRLPAGLEVLEVVGSGRRSITFKARQGGEVVALKVYRPQFIARYRKKYNVNIAVFEMSRNRALRKIPELVSFTARPIRVIGHDGQHSLCFMQEFIDGVPLPELAKQHKGLPVSVLRAGEQIVRLAAKAGLHDLDLYYKNVLARQVGGQWLPVLHDFNLMPQHEHPPNPFLALAYRTGLRKKSHRDLRCLEQWRALTGTD